MLEDIQDSIQYLKSSKNTFSAVSSQARTIASNISGSFSE
jgi:hypothetical protein